MKEEKIDDSEESKKSSSQGGPIRQGSVEECVREERLKWQMSMENLRRECKQNASELQEKHVGEITEWRERILNMEKKCKAMEEEVEEGREAKDELSHTRTRYKYYMYINKNYM